MGRCPDNSNGRSLDVAAEAAYHQPVSRATLGLMLLAVSCSGARGVPGDVAPTDPPVREAPLTVDEAARILSARGPELSRCYTFERLNMNLPDGADYVAQVFVPNDGSQPVVELVASSVPGIETLESCIVRTLQSTRFPAHAGPPLTINVPIRAPR